MKMLCFDVCSLFTCIRIVDKPPMNKLLRLCQTLDIYAYNYFAQYLSITEPNYKQNTAKMFTIENAIESGYIELVKWLYYNMNYYNWWYNAPTQIIARHIYLSARYGHTQLTVWFIEQNYNPYTAMNEAIYYDKLNVVKAISKYIVEYDALNEAIRYGKLEIAKWLLANRPERNISSGCISAAFNGYIDIFEWIYNETGNDETFRLDIPNECLKKAIYGSHFQLIELFLIYGLTVDITDYEMRGVNKKIINLVLSYS